jgi:hypothetical protein
MLMSEVKPFKIIEDVPKAKRAGVKRVKIYYGPFTLLPANVRWPRQVRGLIVNTHSL